jgi:hypothetical protein
MVTLDRYVSPWESEFAHFGKYLSKLRVRARGIEYLGTSNFVLGICGVSRTMSRYVIDSVKMAEPFN